MALIQNIQISSEGYFSCPLKSCVIFRGFKYAELSNPLFELFNDVENEQSLEKILVGFGNQLPNIRKTNIRLLEKWAY